MSNVKTVPAAVAMLRVLEAWGVENVYGYPGGSVNSTMNALDLEKEKHSLCSSSSRTSWSSCSCSSC